MVIACGACGGAQKPTVDSKVPPSVIQREIRSHNGKFRGCYDSGVARNPKLGGKVVVRFVIDLDGNVTSVFREAATDMPDAGVVDCIMTAYKNLKFPSPEGRAITVIHPIMFSPDDENPRDPASPLP